MFPHRATWLGLLFWCLAVTTALARQSAYEKDVAFALAELEKSCGSFFDLKEIDWKKVAKQFAAEANSVETDQTHMVLLTRLLARLEDGHAQVVPSKKTEALRWPEEGPYALPSEAAGPGMFLCRVAKKLYVKSVWSSAAEVGLEPGMELIKVDGLPAQKWLDARIAKQREWKSCSTDTQMFFFACHAGLADKPGTRLELELKDTSGKPKKRTLTYAKAKYGPWGPAVFPPDLKSEGDVNYGLLKSGFAYVHVRRCPDELPTQIDVALAAVAGAPGMVLDFRGNSGGGMDHDQFMGRFVPQGTTLEFVGRYASAGAQPYGGPIVVIVDGTVVSTGETASGIFKEDGRAYMIGESSTAGMSSQKTTIELPSGLFSLYVSTGSNKGRFNGGRGIEGIGVIPHELVEFDPKDLARGVDTLIARAEALLAKFPADKVPYKAR